MKFNPGSELSPHPKKQFVSVVGNIGVGKTTFAEVLAERFGWKIYYEKVIDNPFLPDYYSDMKKWSFHLQIYFFVYRFRDQMEMNRSMVSGVTDRSIYEDPMVFARMLNNQGFLSDRDYKTCLEVFESFEEFLPKPDLFIYLRASTWTLLSRIRNRGRDFEMGITAEFLHQLNMAYDTWTKQLATSHNLLIVDTNQFNIQKEKNKKEELIQTVQELLERPSIGLPTIV